MCIDAGRCAEKQVSHQTFHVILVVQGSMYDSLGFFIPAPQGVDCLPQLQQLWVLQKHLIHVSDLVLIRVTANCC